MAENKITLAYWVIKGYGEVLRQLCEYTGLLYENKIYIDPTEWFGKDKLSLKSDFPNLPYIIDGEKTLTESEACALYIIYKTNKLELIGSNEDEVVRITQIKGVLNDTWNNLKKVYMDENGDLVQGLTNTVIPKLTLLSKHLGSRNWLIEKGVTIVDFFFYGLLYTVNLQGNFLDAFPNLIEYKNRYENLEQIKNYLASDRNLKVPVLNYGNPNVKLN